MPAFTLRKVVDPREHMSKDVRQIHYELMRSWNVGNNSFHFWKVGQDYDKELDPLYYALETWAREHFNFGEELIILNWW